MKHRMTISVLLGCALLGFVAIGTARTDAQSDARVVKEDARAPRTERVETDRVTPCETIECIKRQLELTPTEGMPIKISDQREAARAANPKFDELLDRAHQIARDRVLTDVASEEYFSQTAEKLDRGIALDGDSTRYTVLDDGTEELLVVAGTKSDVRVLLGNRNPGTGLFEISLHLVGDGETRRVVRMADSLTMGRESTTLAKVEELALAGDAVVAISVPTVECFGFSNTTSIRIVCICYTNDSNGFSGKICFDSGWVAA